MSDIHTKEVCWDDLLMTESKPLLPNGWIPITSSPPPGFPRVGRAETIDTKFLRSLPQFNIFATGRISIRGLILRGPKDPAWYLRLRETEKFKAHSAQEKMHRMTKEYDEQTTRAQFVERDTKSEVLEAEIVQFKVDKALASEIQSILKEYRGMKKDQEVHHTSQFGGPLSAPAPAAVKLFGSGVRSMSISAFCMTLEIGTPSGHLTVASTACHGRSGTSTVSATCTALRKNWRNRLESGGVSMILLAWVCRSKSSRREPLEAANPATTSIEQPKLTSYSILRRGTIIAGWKSTSPD
jgi:hypothetical protein